MDDDTKMRLADQAQALMRSDVAQEAFRRADATFLQQWRHGKTVEDREAAHHRIMALEELRRQFQGMQDEKPLAQARKRQRGAA